MPDLDLEAQDGEETVEKSTVISDETVSVALPHQQGGTLLPHTAAAIVSGITGLTSFSLRAGAKIGGWGLYAGREATLKTLSVSRSALETILLAAGQDAVSRSGGGLGEADTLSILERSISALHSSISTISFIASSGFYLTEAYMNSVSGVSLHALATMNAIFGSTETSRAVAAIITLIHDEMQKPGPGSQGEIVGNMDLIYGTISFVLLQRWGRRKTELEFREEGGEESIWDTVIDDKGFRADVIGTRRKETINLTAKAGSTMPFASRMNDDDLEVLESGTLFGAQNVALSPEEQAQLSEEEIRERIIRQLPQGARAVVSSETITAKTIKVEIYDGETAHIEAPPGTVLVAERLNQHVANGTSKQEGPHQTVIFRTALKRTNSTEIEPEQRLRLTEAVVVDEPAEEDDDNDDIVMMKITPEKVTRDRSMKPHFEENVIEDSDDEHLSPATLSPHLQTGGPTANQKKSRRPIQPLDKSSSASKVQSRIPTPRSYKERAGSAKKSEKGRGMIKKALKTLSPSQSSASFQDMSPRKSITSKPLPDLPTPMTPTSFRNTTPQRIYPMPSLSNGHSPLTSPTHSWPQQPNNSNYFSVHENRRDSLVSLTETYSVHSIESRPGSPTFTRTHTRVVSSNGLTQTKSELGLSLKPSESRPTSSGGLSHHRRSKSFLPSLYSMATKDSGEAIILAPKIPVRHKSIYEDDKMLAALAKDGKVPGIFPDRHLAKTIRRFSKFATASYGSNFLHLMGLTSAEKNLSKSTELMTLDVHTEHTSFSTHTGLPADTILLSSFFDPKGVMGNAEWTSAAISPLIHFISIDHDSKAVVLTCRGTLGFEDVLTDMTCDYDDLFYQGQRYKVHKGIHASARRLLGGSGSRVMATLKASLEEYPDYGLVLCGHSLGGAVAALVAILISEPCHEEGKPSFATSAPPKLLTASDQNTASSMYIPPINLPTGRPIHVYAFGSPATVSEPLRLATRGLITTIVNHADIVPSLSLGTLHDFRTVALHLKHDTSEYLTELKPRVKTRVMNAINKMAFGDHGPPPPESLAGDGLGEDNWAWACLKTLRASMVSDKLVPPGEVFIIETSRVFDRLDPDVAREAVFGPDDSKDDRSEKLYRALGRPATRVQFKLVRNVEKRFGELRFGRDMFGDHSPGRYEAGLSLLEKGIYEE